MWNVKNSDLLKETNIVKAIHQMSNNNQLVNRICHGKIGPSLNVQHVWYKFYV